MILRFIRRAVFYPILLLSLIIYLITCTTFGLRCVLYAAELRHFGTVRITSLKGSLLQGLEVKGLNYKDQHQTLSIQTLTIKPDWRGLRERQVSFVPLKLSHLSYRASDASTPTTIDALTLLGAFDFKKHVHQFNISHIQGHFEGQSYHGASALRYAKGHFLLGQSQITWDKTEFSIKPFNEHYQWQFKSQQLPNLPPSTLSGTVKLAQSRLSGVIDEGVINLPGTPAWQLTAPSVFRASFDELDLEPMYWKQHHYPASAKLVGHWNQAQGFQAQLVGEGNLSNLEVLLPNNLKINALFALKAQFSQATNEAMKADIELAVAPGYLALCDQDAKILEREAFQGGKLNASLDKDLKAELKFTVKPGTYLQGSFGLSDFDPKRYLNQPLQSTLDFEIKDLSLLQYWLPDITSLRASPKGHLTLSGTLAKPNLLGNIDIDRAQFVIQRAGLAVRNLGLHLHATEQNLVLHGRAYSGQGHADFKGHWAYKSADAPKLEIKGHQFQVINTRRYKLEANPDLNIEYLGPKELSVYGNLTVPSAEINLESNQNQTVITDDIVFTDHKDKKVDELQTRWNIKPQVYLRLENHVIFKKQGLQAIVGGKIQIEQYAYGFLFGSGRLTIKEGKYRIGGKPFYIHHGRLIFQPVTLLTNPSLDIKLTPKPRSQLLPGEADEMGLTVQGTVSNPIIDTFSTGNLAPSDVLQRLGLAGYMTAIAEGTGSSGDLMERIQDKLGLDEINVETGGGSEGGGFSLKTPLENKTTIRIKKRLNERFRIQVEQSREQQQDTTENTTKAKLDFLFNPHWTLGVETGTQGTGADLTYSREKD